MLCNGNKAVTSHLSKYDQGNRHRRKKQQKLMIQQHTHEKRHLQLVRIGSYIKKLPKT